MVFVAVIDSGAPEYPAEFGYLLRDWIGRHSKTTLKGRKVSFAVLDWGYVDGTNPMLFEKYRLPYS